MNGISQHATRSNFCSSNLIVRVNNVSWVYHAVPCLCIYPINRAVNANNVSWVYHAVTSLCTCMSEMRISFPRTAGYMARGDENHACGDENHELDPRVAMWLCFLKMDVYTPNMAIDPALTWAFLDQSAWLEDDDENQQLTVEYFENRGIPRHDAVTLSENAYKNRLAVIIYTRQICACGSCGQRRAFIDYKNQTHR